MTTESHTEQQSDCHTHGAEELCREGSELYARALREGRVHKRDTEQAPCLLRFGLLVAADDDPTTLRPVAPAVALPRLLGGYEEEIVRQRRRSSRLADQFAPLIALETQRASIPSTPMFRVLMGFQRINEAIDEAAGEASLELLTIQPGGRRPRGGSPRRSRASRRSSAAAAGCARCTSTRPGTPPP